MDTSTPLRPFEHAYRALVTAFLNGEFPAGAALPAERELAAQLGVTRPTLREALGRLASEGWVNIQHGKPTRVNDYWREGGLNVLHSLVRYAETLPPDFIPNLLQVRLALAPAYTAAAIARQPNAIAACLQTGETLANTPEAFAAFDWQLHYLLTTTSGNPIYTLILNGFAGFYQQMACLYFSVATARQASRQFYEDLRQAAQDHNPSAAESICRATMRQSIAIWQDGNRAGSEAQ